MEIKPTVASLACKISHRILPHVEDWSRRQDLEAMLIEFAAEIKRSAKE